MVFDRAEAALPAKDVFHFLVVLIQVFRSLYLSSQGTVSLLTHFNNLDPHSLLLGSCDRNRLNAKVVHWSKGLRSLAEAEEASAEL